MSVERCPTARMQGERLVGERLRCSVASVEDLLKRLLVGATRAARRHRLPHLVAPTIRSQGRAPAPFAEKDGSFSKWRMTRRALLVPLFPNQAGAWPQAVVKIASRRRTLSGRMCSFGPMNLAGKLVRWWALLSDDQRAAVAATRHTIPDWLTNSLEANGVICVRAELGQFDGASTLLPTIVRDFIDSSSIDPHGREDHHSRSVADALVEIAAAALTRISGAVHASITVVGNGAPHVVASAGSQLEAVARSEFDHGEGPTLTALQDGKISRLTSSLLDAPWPMYAQVCRTEGIGSVIAFPVELIDSTYSAALTVYSEDYHGFSVAEIRSLASVASEAAPVVQMADLEALEGRRCFSSAVNRIR